MQLRVDLASPADDAAIRGLLRRQPMPGAVSLTYEREPDFSLGCGVTGDDFQVVVARNANDGEIIGVACRSARKLYFNGQERRLGYLGQLRIDARFQGRWLLSRGFSLLKELHDRDPLPGYLASIVDGNHEATGVLIQKRRKLFPTFRAAADISTLAISVGRPKPPAHEGLEITSADETQLGALACFLQTHGRSRQFFPVWSEDAIRSLSARGLHFEDLQIARHIHNREIAGVAGLWDQSAYKQMVVRGYSGWIKAVAPLYNLGAPWLGRPLLPQPGEPLRSVYAAFICIANDDSKVFVALLRQLYNIARARNFEYLLIGLDVRDPLLRVAREYSHVPYRSRLYLAEWPNGGHLHEQLDQRPAYVDIATL
jgi:hypothetical protein